MDSRSRRYSKSGGRRQLNAESLFDYRTFRNPAKAFDLVSYAGFVGFSVYFWYLLYCGLSWAHKASVEDGPAA